VTPKRRAPKGYEGGRAIAETAVDNAYRQGHASHGLAKAAVLSVGRNPISTKFHAIFVVYGRSH
jgi:hypothetical protein